jgi:rhomboid protease GluP
VTYTILVVTILIFIAQVASQSLTGEDWPAILGMKVNELILRGQLWRLFTPMLLHASILHIGFNMYALNIFGPGLERNFGHLRFLVLYVLSGFAGNVMSFAFSPAPSLGASTAIFGLLGAEGVFLYQNRELFGSSARAALTNIAMIAVINLALGLRPGIDNWGHIGGLIGGTLFTWLGGPKLHVEGIYPDLRVADERESGDVVRATIVVGVLFVFIAGGVFYLRG